jgi:prevent-host-death family protein
MAMIMKTVSARQANHEFSALLSRAERGEEILITKHNKPVAVLGPYRSPGVTAERKKAIEHALRLMKKGLPWGDALPRFTRDEMQSLISIDTYWRIIHRNPPRLVVRQQRLCRSNFLLRA